MPVELAAAAVVISDHALALAAYLTHAGQDPCPDDPAWQVMHDRLRDKLGERELDAMRIGLDPHLLAAPEDHLASTDQDADSLGWRESDDLHVVCSFACDKADGRMLGSAPPAGWECWDSLLGPPPISADEHLYRPQGSTSTSLPTAWPTPLHTMEDRLDALHSDTEPT